MRIFAFKLICGLVCCFVGVLAGPAASYGQAGCMTGKVSMVFGVNGDIKVCPQLDAKAPELQKQLDAMQASLAGNKTLLLELTHSARGVNALGKDVDGARQVELLKSFARQLQASSSADQAKTQEEIAGLANKLDSVQEMIATNKEDTKTAAQTDAALRGQLGDAIAKLDLTKAESQLDAIQAKLVEIGGDVKATRQNTDEINARLKAQQAQDVEDRKKKVEEEHALNEDPNMYTRAQIMPEYSMSSTQTKLMVYFYSRPPLYPPFVDSKFSIAFRKGTEAWRVDAKDKQMSGGGELWHVTLDEVGDKASFCFVAHDQASGRLKEWMQRYTVTPASGPQKLNFIPDGNAVMRLTDGGPCDGVTEAKVQKPEESVQESIAKMHQRQMADATKTMADARVGALRAGPSIQRFADIMASATRKSGSRWMIEVDVDPGLGAKLYDEHIEMKMIDAAGKATIVGLSNRTMLGAMERRGAAAAELGTKAVVCLTATDPPYPKAYTLTQRFSIETTQTGAGGESGAFVNAAPPTIAEANGAACQ